MLVPLVTRDGLAAVILLVRAVVPRVRELLAKPVAEAATFLYHAKEERQFRHHIRPVIGS